VIELDDGYLLATCSWKEIERVQMEERCRYERDRGKGWRGTVAMVMTSNGRASSSLFLIQSERSRRRASP
jgi:hypothetical protein